MFLVDKIRAMLESNTSSSVSYLFPQTKLEFVGKVEDSKTQLVSSDTKPCRSALFPLTMFNK